MAISEKKPYESLNAYLDRVLPAELEAGKSRGKATAEIIFKFNEEKKEEPPFTKWGFAGGKGSNDIVATGGTITQDNDYKVHTFTSNGTFEIVSGSGQVEYLVQGGGGSGAKNGGSFGGGGAGGGIEVDTLFGRVKSYAVVVGAGGANKVGSSYEGNDGADSSLDGSVIGCGGEGGKSFTGGINCDFTATGKAGASNNSNATSDSLGPDGLFSSITGASTQYGRGGDSDNSSRTGVVGQGGHGGSGLGITSGAGADGIVITRYYSPAGAGDVDADAYIAAVKSSGGTLSAGDEAAIQTLYTDLKSNSLYTKLQLFYPMMGGIAASTAINGNLNTNFDITWNGSLTFNSNGVTGTGTNGDYGNTNFTPSIDGGGNDFSYGIYTTAGNFDQEKYMFGALGNGFLDIPRGDSVNEVGIYGWSASQRQAMTFTRGDGQYTGTFDTTSGEKTLYFNADVVGYPSVTSTPGGGFGRANQDVFLFTLNLNGSPYTNNYWDGSCRFFYYGDYLTQSEVETINTVIQTFQTSLGRNTY